MAYTKLARISSDVPATFGAAGASWLDQRLVRGTVAWDLHTDGIRMPDPTVQDRLHAESLHRRGSKFGSTLGAQFLLEGLQSADSLGNAGAYLFPEANISEILKAMMGGSAGAIGSLVVAAGSTTAIVNVTPGDGVNWAVGTFVGFTTTSGFEVRRVIANAANSVTVHMDLASIPANGSTAYNFETLYLDEDGVGGDAQALALRLLGYDANDQWLCAGVGGTFTIGMALNELLTMTCQFMVADPTQTSGETFAGATYDGGGGLPVRAGSVQYADAPAAATTQARNILAAQSFEIDPGLVLSEEGAISGTETVNRWRMENALTKARLGVRHHVEMNAFMTDYEAQTSKSIGIQIGTAPAAETGGTGIVYFHLPRVQWTRAPQRTEDGGFVRSALEFDAEEDQATGLATDIGVSKLYIAIG